MRLVKSSTSTLGMLRVRSQLGSNPVTGPQVILRDRMDSPRWCNRFDELNISFRANACWRILETTRHFQIASSNWVRWNRIERRLPHRIGDTS